LTAPLDTFTTIRCADAGGTQRITGRYMHQGWYWETETSFTLKTIWSFRPTSYLWPTSPFRPILVSRPT